MEWPPDYNAELYRRARLEHALTVNLPMREAAKAMYKASLPTFVNDCVWVYEPRNAPLDPTRLPAVPFPRQVDFLNWMVERFTTKISAPCVKSRDSGATWMAAAFAVHLWLFEPGSVVGFGSRKEMLVDRQGDLNSIFEKVRSIVRSVPHYLKPEGFSERAHSNYMRLINPAIESSIVGEAGDNIGRGGRTSVYIVDESAYLEHAELVEAALTANTDVRIDISSPLLGTLFQRDAETNRHQFIFDVSDAPWHTREWMAKKQAELDAKGVGHIFRREYLRDASAGIAGQLIPADWVEACVGACDKLKIKPTGRKSAALDVADGGGDANALALKHGVQIERVTSRPDLLADQAGAWAWVEANRFGAELLRYDSIGVGAGAAAALRGKKAPICIGWNAAGAVVAPGAKYEGNRSNDDMFANAKAQGWWALRDACLATYRLVTGQFAGDTKPSIDDIISFDPDMPELRELKAELSQVTYKHNTAGKVVIDKVGDGKKSPNRADSVMIANAPTAPGIQIIGKF